MKKQLMVNGLIILALVFGACQAQQQSSKAEEKATAPSNPQSDSRVVEEIQALLQRHDKALSDKNLDSLMETFSPAPNTVVLGTGEGERWEGSEEIKQAYTEIFKDYDPNTLEASCDWKTGQHLGDMAWMAATCQLKDSLKGKKREYTLNVSAAAVKHDGKWRFSMLHMSNMTGS